MQKDRSVPNFLEVASKGHTVITSPYPGAVVAAHEKLFKAVEKPSTAKPQTE